MNLLVRAVQNQPCGTDGSWGPDNHEDGTEAPCLFFSPKFHHHVQKNSPLDIVVSRQNPVLTFTTYLF